MVTILDGLCGYCCVLWGIVCCDCGLPEEPVIYDIFSWDEGVYFLGGEKCEARGVAEVG